jgi:transcriptional regulator with XRE-family HTH domain/tetratricopeptide (TPR) repeat protein
LLLVIRGGAATLGGVMATKPSSPLAHARQAAGYTQERFAEELGVDRSTVGRWERGVQAPLPWQRPDIATALKITLDQLDSLLPEPTLRAQLGPAGRQPQSVARLHDDALLAGFHELETAKVEHKQRGRGQSITEAQANADGLRPPAPWEHDLVRRLHRTDVGSETIEQLQIATEEMSCEYAWRDANELRTDARHYLHYISQLLDGSCTLREHRELLVLAGWLMLLTGCVDYDTGRHRQAELNRAAAFHIGRETGHGEIVAWTFEMSAWFALTQGHWRSVAQYSEAGTEAAPHTSVVVQLAAQSAKAAARMGQRDEVSKILDNGYRALSQHERPSRPENHFVIDPQKWDFYAMDCYRLVGEDQRAADHAQEVLRISRRPDGSDRSPMRATEARLTLAVVALRQGDLEAAAEWTRKALAAPRKSVDQLAMVADELNQELHRLFPDDPATRTITALIGQAYAGAVGVDS